MFGKKPFLGIDIGMYSVKIAEVSLNRGYPMLERIALMPTGKRNGLGREALIKFLREGIRKYGIPLGKSASTLSADAAVVRSMRMPRMPTSELEEALRLRLKKDMKENLDEMVIDYLCFSNGGEDHAALLDLLVFAVKRRVVEEHNETLRTVGFTPVSSEVNGTAIQNVLAFSNQVDEGREYVVLDLGVSHTGFLVFGQKGLLFMRRLPVTGSYLSRKIQEECRVEYEKAEQYKQTYGMGEGQDRHASAVREVLESALNELVVEIRSSIDYFMENHSPNIAIQKILLCGGGAGLAGSAEFISRKMGLPCERFPTAEQLRLAVSDHVDKQSLSQTCHSLAVSLGLALRQGR